jgi:hypothetical protein
MEVAHKHHNAPSPDENPWKHYFIEFFMLFLAVSLGFFAENFRDRLVEKERAREMAVGLYNDLKMDSLHLYKVMERKNLFIDEINSLIATLSDKDVKNKITLLTYYQASFLMEIDMPIPSRANLDQLTNSGSLRYFRDKKLVTDISQWDNVITVQFQERFQSDQLRLIEEIKAVSRVFYPVIIDSMRSISFNQFFENENVNSELLESFEKTPAGLITYNEADLNEVIGWASERKRNAIVRSTSFYPKQLEHIRNLMKALNKEFHIDKQN